MTETSIKARFNSLPGPAQVVVKAIATKYGITHKLGNSDAEITEQLTAGLKAWEEDWPVLADGILSQEQVATIIVERLRDQETWGKILRSGAN